MADSTVFDSVFKTMVHKAPRLMIPLVNEVFGRHYAYDEEVIPFSDEHEGLRGTVIDDSVFRLRDKIYHIECQSTQDAAMVVRMIEYDFSIALEQTLAGGPPYRMELPASCVLFLRHTASTPDALRIEVGLPDGGSFEYSTKVVKAQLVSSDDIFNKGLLVLLPYYLMRYEKELSAIAADDVRSAQLISECMDLRIRLAELAADEDDEALYEQLTELIIRVSDYLLDKYELLQKKVRAAMGGEVLELWADRAARMEREARELGYANGLEQGREQGIEQGIEQGKEQTLNELTRRLAELGVDQGLIDEAVATVRESGDEDTVV